MRAIYLTGFMGSGKTTIGKALGEALKLPIIDTDEWIVERHQKQIRDIFADEGEDAFRRYEREALMQLPKENIVITTGGGIVIQKENRERMKDTGLVFYLQCDLDEIYRRLENDTSRPLLDGQKRLNMERLMNERQSWYEEAHVTIPVAARTVDEIVEAIVNVIKDRQNGDNN